MDETPPNIPTNRFAIFSLIASIFTVLSFCIGLSPILFSSLICYPTAVITGVTALITGLISIHQIRRNGENGRGFGLIGAWTGGLMVITTLCAAIIGVVSIPLLITYISKALK